MLNPLDLVRQLLEWGVNQFGLATFGIGVGTLMTVGLWLWWGFKLHIVFGYAKTGIHVAARHLVVSAAVSSLLIAALLWTGVIPGFDVETATNLVSSLTDVLILDPLRAISGGGG